MSQVDCLIVGGGPAGLTAAIYAARFNLSVRLIDAGGGRAASIPRTHNHAGFPEGIAGADLLQLMVRQAVQFGAHVQHGHVAELRRRGEGFEAFTNEGLVGARAVIVATGVTNYRPTMSETFHAKALQAGRMRYCPVCDGFEVRDQSVCIIGTSDRGVREALFLRSFTGDVTLVSADVRHDLTDVQRRCMEEAGVAVLDGPAGEFRLESDSISLAVSAGRRMSFAAIYPAMGSKVHSHLGQALGAAVTEEGCIKVDLHQRSSVPLLYAAGDVVIGLDQISHAMGEAGIAATTLRNDLNELKPLRR